jgi:hypothetical protein
MHNLKTDVVVIVRILTRRAPRAQNEVLVVFDLVGTGHILSELHAPDMDGFSFKAAPAKHKHVSVKAKK